MRERRWRPLEPPRWSWAGLSPEQREVAWQDLGRWVGWLVSTYGMGEEVIPPCWPRHPELVEELRVLREWHRDVYSPEVEVDERGEVVERPLRAGPREAWDWQVARRVWQERVERGAHYRCGGSEGHRDSGRWHLEEYLEAMGGEVARAAGEDEEETEAGDAS